MRFTALIVFILLSLPVQGQIELMGPLRIRDMTPFNILRLDMSPAPAITQDWSIEAVLSRTNVFMMSDNVKDHLARRGTDGPLTQDDAEAIAALGEDSYFVDGEIGLLDLTFQYGFAYVALSVYDFTGGFLDSTSAPAWCGPTGACSAYRWGAAWCRPSPPRTR